MSRRLQAIENAITAINPTVFQELCDSYLAIRNQNCRAFSRTGSQSGKQKTVTGTPDSFLVLPNGRYIFFEHSTNISAGIKKLIDDLKKGLNEAKTGVPVNEIEEIIFCLNFNLEPFEIEQLKDIARSKHIAISVYTNDRLAIELNLNHRDLAHIYLGLPLDSGQVVSIERFVAEYNRASNSIATPLDNKFLFREREMNALKSSVLSNDFIILNGTAGVGKTKFAIEGIKTFLAENKSFEAYCISYKSHSLLDDLYQYFDENKDYILFVDDANRIDAFLQIIGFYKVPRKGKLKIVLTVRDYAFNYLYRLCLDYSPVSIEISKFTDDQIKAIIAEKPFEILNPDYQKEIIRIADGNPRLAIMGALLAKAEQNIYVLHDVSDLFEKYFSTFVKDDGEFENTLNIKCLGLISFFYTIPYTEKGATTSILSKFNIEYVDFIDAIDRLDKLELIEIRYDHVKIPEQNLATFFFYKAVLKDRLLSFPTLLKYYFDSNTGRFSDSVISANNTFGYTNVMGKLLPALREHWKEITFFECKAMRFLSVFWFYLYKESTAYFYNRIEQMPDVSTETYNLKYERNAFSYQSKDNIIEILGNYFRSSIQIEDFLELGLRYCRKKPEDSAELLNKIRERLTFDREDESQDYIRQKILFEVIQAHVIKGDQLCLALFFELAETFLARKYHHTKGGRGNTIFWYDYPLPYADTIKKLRKSIWELIYKYYQLNPEKSFTILENLIGLSIDGNLKIARDDLQYVIRIVKKHFDPENLSNVKYVKDLEFWCKRNKIISKRVAGLSQQFNNADYEFFRLVDWDRFRDREMYEFNNLKEYEDLKEQEIRRSFMLKSVAEVKEFYRKFVLSNSITKSNWTYTRTLDFVLDENFKRKFATGLSLLKEIVKNDNVTHFIPRVAFYNRLKKPADAEKIFDVITAPGFSNRTGWSLAFFDYLDDSLINNHYTTKLLLSMEKMESGYTISFNNLERYLKVDKDLFIKILRIIVEKNERADMKINLWMDFFTQYFGCIEADMKLVKKAFLQQVRIRHSFDHDGSDLLKILEKEPKFLLEYIKNLLENDEFISNSEVPGLKIVWRIDKIEATLKQVFDYVASKDFYFGLSHFCNSFFNDLSEEDKARAKRFVFQYMKSNSNDIGKIKMIVDLARNSLQASFDEILLNFLTLNQDVKVFSKIPWRGTMTSGSGGTILSDIEMADWKRIESIVARASGGLKLIPIRKFISDRIDYCKEKGDLERQRKFVSGF